MNERGVASGGGGCKPKRNVMANSDWCEWLWNKVSLLQVIARKAKKKEGRGPNEGGRGRTTIS